jgi:hypothetical protein
MTHLSLGRTLFPTHHFNFITIWRLRDTADRAGKMILTQVFSSTPVTSALSPSEAS